jgi:hypothetical protein
MLIALAVMGLAFWAYQENHKTQQALKTVDRLQQEIALTRGRLNVLKAEWAYLNRPGRLKDLAEINFDRLGLLPLTSAQFATIDEIAFPLPGNLPITDPVEVSTQEVSQ